MTTARGPIARAVYRPGGRTERALLTSGLHPSGIDEPRLVTLARQLAASRRHGRHARHSGAVALRDHAGDHRRDRGRRVWLAVLIRRSHRTASVALMGISFSGGLSVVAAGRPSLAGRVAVRVLVRRPRRPAARAAVSVHRHRAAAAAGAAAGTMTRAIRSCGRRTTTASRSCSTASPIASCRQRRSSACAPRSGGSCWRRRSTRVDKAAGANASSRRCATLAATLPEPSATLLRYVNDRDVVHLGARLLPYVELYGGDPACRRRSRRSRPRRCSCCTAPTTT